MPYVDKLGFNFGEVSSRSMGNHKGPQYEFGCSLFKDLMVGRHGQAFKRYGTEDAIASMGYGSRLIPFDIRSVGKFVVELFNSNLRVIDTATRLVVTPSLISTPWDNSQIFEIQYAQTKDTLYLTSKAAIIRKLTRSGVGVWSLSTVVGPAIGAGSRAKSITITYSTGPNVIRLDSDYLTPTDTGAIFRIGSGFVFVDQVSSAREATVTPLTLPPVVGSTRSWYGPFVPQTPEVGSVIQSNDDSPNIAGNVFDFTYSGGPFMDESYMNRIADINYGVTAAGAPGVAPTRMAYVYGVNPAALNSGTMQLIQGPIIPAFYGSTGGIQWFVVQERVGDNLFITPNLAFVDEIWASAPVFTADQVGSAYLIGGFSYPIVSVATPQRAIVVSGIAAGVPAISKVRYGTSDWSATASGSTGFFNAVTVHQDRLVLGGVRSSPLTVFISKIGDYENFELGVEATSAMELTLSAPKGGEIAWIRTAGSLLIGTSVGEYAISGVPLTPTNLGSALQSTYGGAAVQTEQAGTTILFVGRDKRSIREMIFRYEQDQFQAPEISEFSEHLFDGSIREMCYAQNLPEQILLVILANNTVLGLSYRRERDVLAWSKWGFSASSACLVSPEASGDEFWISTSRGRLEVLKQGAYRMDAQQTVATSFPLITGLIRLAGQQVQVLADDRRLPDRFVDNGGVLDISAYSTSHSSVTFGLGFKSELVPTVPQFVDNFKGSTRGRVASITDANIRLVDSRGGVFRSGIISFSLTGETADFSGIVPATSINAVDRIAAFSIESTSPYNFEVLSISMNVLVGG